MRYRNRLLRCGFLAGLALAFAACGPTAEPTATTAPSNPTATTARPTATTSSAPTATSAAGQATATRAAAPTATVAETKLRLVPVVAVPPPNPQAKKGGVFRALNASDPPDFGIWDSANGSTLGPSVPATDSLLDRNEFVPDKVDQILPSLAYDWWTDQSATLWTFKLREGVKFNDGKPFTCADAKFSLEVIRDARDATGATMRRSPRGSWLKRATGITCPDATTLQIKTDGPLPSLPYSLALSSFAIMPKHIYEGHLDLWLKEPIKVGLGPFNFDSYRVTESYKMKRNPGYWQQPYPFLDGYERPNLGSATAVTAAFRVGRGETGGVTAQIRDQMEAEGKVSVYGRVASDGFLGIEVNRLKAPWNDPRFAEAVRCAIDSGEVIKTGYAGFGFEGPIAPMPTTPGGAPWSISEADWKAIGPCHGPSGDAANMEKRRQRAKELLAQMGFTAANPARPLMLWIDSQKDPSIPIDSELRAVGIIPNLQYLPTGPIYDKFTAGEFDIGTPASYATSRRDPDHWFYEQFYSTSDRMYSKYTNPVTDTLIDKQSKTADPAERVKIIHELIKTLTKENAKIIAAHTYSASVAAIWVKDAYPGAPTNSQNTYAKFQRVWIDQDKLKQMTGG